MLGSPGPLASAHAVRLSDPVSPPLMCFTIYSQLRPQQIFSRWLDFETSVVSF